MRCSIKEKLVVAFAAVVLLMMVVVLLPYRSTLSNEYRVNVGRAETERSGSYRISSVRDGKGPFSVRIDHCLSDAFGSNRWMASLSDSFRRLSGNNNIDCEN